MKKVFMYCRKSQESEERQALSIPSQLQELNKIVVRDGLTVIHRFEESQSAKKPGRSIFGTMLQELKKQGVKKLLVWNPDRLSRNSVDTGQIIYLMDEEIIDEILTPTQNFQATPNDKFLFNILCGQAKLENDNRGINAQRGMRTKAENGWYPAPAPIGYLNTPDRKKGFKVINIDPDSSPLVRKAFEFIIAGEQPIRAWKIARNEWKLVGKSGQPISRSAFYFMLTNPFYFGEYEWPKNSGNWFKGNHQPIISRDEFDIIQRMLGKKGKPIARTHQFELTGLIRCYECGCAITATRKTKYYKSTERTAVYTYYHCTKKNKQLKCNQAPLTEKELLTQIDALLGQIRLKDEFLAWARKWMKVVHEKESTFQEATLKKRQESLYRIENRLNKLLDMRLDELLDEKNITRRKFNLRQKEMRHEQRLKVQVRL